VEIACELPEGHPGLPEIVGLLGALAGALVRHQRSEGGWGTVINDPGSYEEASGTAMCAYALARAARRGWLPEAMGAAARRALASVTARMEAARGGFSMPAISAATNPMPGAAYALVPRVRDAPWGVGAYLLAACEAS